jgi:hypothetical protein
MQFCMNIKEKYIYHIFLFWFNDYSITSDVVYSSTFMVWCFIFFLDTLLSQCWQAIIVISFFWLHYQSECISFRAEVCIISIFKMWIRFKWLQYVCTSMGVCVCVLALHIPISCCNKGLDPWKNINFWFYRGNYRTLALLLNLIL